MERTINFLKIIGFITKIDPLRTIDINFYVSFKIAVINFKEGKKIKEEFEIQAKNVIAYRAIDKLKLNCLAEIEAELYLDNEIIKIKANKVEVIEYYGEKNGTILQNLFEA